MEERGYEIKRGKYISVRASDQERFTRIKTLGNDYSEEAIIQRIKSKSRPFPIKKEDRNRDRIIDTHTEKMQDSPGLRNWAMKQNLQVASEAVRIIQASGFSSLETVEKELDKVTHSCEENRSTIVQIEDRMRHLC